MSRTDRRDRCVLCVAVAGVEVAWWLVFTAVGFAAVTVIGAGGAAAGWIVGILAFRRA